MVACNKGYNWSLKRSKHFKAVPVLIQNRHLRLLERQHGEQCKRRSREAEKHVLQVNEVHDDNMFQFVSLDLYSILQEFAGGAERGEGLALGLTCWRKGYQKSPG